MNNLSITKFLGGACAGVALLAAAAPASANTLDLGIGGTISNGVMFDLVVGQQALTLTSLTFLPVQSGTFRVYGYDGSYTGAPLCPFGQSCLPPGWTQIGSTEAPFDPTLPEPPLGQRNIGLNWTLAAGSTHGIYITGLAGASLGARNLSGSDGELTATLGQAWYSPLAFDIAHARSSGYTLAGTFNYTLVGGLGVPEPATWTMMLVGFGGLGAALRANRRRALAS